MSKDPKHLAKVRELPCRVNDTNCYGDIIAHHPTSLDHIYLPDDVLAGGGTASKLPDAFAYPLCCNHHQVMPVFPPARS